MTTQMSSRQFNQDTSGAKKAAENGPVYITDRGRPAHVLLTFDDYEELVGPHRALDLLAEPAGVADIEFVAPKNTDVARPGSVRVMFVLDTNIVSELRKVRSGRRTSGLPRGPSKSRRPSCSSPRSRSTNSSTACCSWSVPIPRREQLLRAWLDQSVPAAFKNRVLPVDERVARRAAALHVPDPAPFRDALIGATALVRDMTVVTRDLKDFQRFDELDVLNPWS
jgi:toxin FitB